MEGGGTGTGEWHLDPYGKVQGAKDVKEVGTHGLQVKHSWAADCLQSCHLNRSVDQKTFLFRVEAKTILLLPTAQEAKYFLLVSISLQKDNLFFLLPQTRQTAIFHDFFPLTFIYPNHLTNKAREQVLNVVLPLQ